MAIAIKNIIGGYDDVSYNAINGKTVRQIILGKGIPKKDLRLEDCKYMYIGADRATEKWKPFHFETNRLLMNNNMYVNVIPIFDSYYPQQIKRSDVYGYSYKYKGFDLLEQSKTITLFGLRNNTSIPTDEITVKYDGNKLILHIMDSVTGDISDIWESDTSIQNATFIINLYATNSYLYKNTTVKPKLFADIILDYPDNSQQHEHVVYTSRNVLGEFGGQCLFLSKFFSERREITDCTAFTDLSNIDSNTQISIFNYFVRA